jgi:hypothetical protein
MRTRIAAATFAAALAFPFAARAQTTDTPWDGDYQPSGAKRRSDLAIGAALGVHLGSAEGYPNEVDKLDNPAFKSATSSTLGPGGAVWLGVALTDWLNVALGASRVTLGSGRVQAQATGFICRVETFPLLEVGGAFRDLGVAGNFGLGLLKIEEDRQEKADGGVNSLLSVGVFHEALRFSGFTLGPLLEYTHMWSVSASLSTTTLGARLAFYSGPG